MHKKVIVTNEKIFQAFTDLLNVKDYNRITVQDILDQSGVARSTFYAHYKTKDEVLENICKIIFDHVFSRYQREERSHNFSRSSELDYKHFITHILYHLRDERPLMKAIFSSQGKGIFLDYFRQQLRSYAVDGVEQQFFPAKEVPCELKASSVIENFIVVIEYWIDSDFAETPERLTDYIVSLNC